MPENIKIHQHIPTPTWHLPGTCPAHEFQHERANREPDFLIFVFCTTLVFGRVDVYVPGSGSPLPHPPRPRSFLSPQPPVGVGWGGMWLCTRCIHGIPLPLWCGFGWEGGWHLLHGEYIILYNSWCIQISGTWVLCGSMYVAHMYVVHG